MDELVLSVDGGGFFARIIDQLLDEWQNALDNDGNTFFGWMHAIWQIEVPFSGDPIQKEGIEGGVIFFREVRENTVEVSCIIIAHIGRCQHACDQDFDAALRHLLKDGVKIGSGHFRLYAAEGIV